MIKCSKCLGKDHPCSDCRLKILRDLKRDHLKRAPWKLKILILIIDGWIWLGWLPYKLKIVKLKL